MSAKVEFFTDDVDGQEYLNVGLVWTDEEGETVRAVLGAFQGEPGEEALVIIRALVETACEFIADTPAILAP